MNNETSAKLISNQEQKDIALIKQDFLCLRSKIDILLTNQCRKEEFRKSFEVLNRSIGKFKDYVATDFLKENFNQLKEVRESILLLSNLINGLSDKSAKAVMSVDEVNEKLNTTTNLVGGLNEGKFISSLGELSKEINGLNDRLNKAQQGINAQLTLLENTCEKVSNIHELYIGERKKQDKSKKTMNWVTLTVCLSVLGFLVVDKIFSVQRGNEINIESIQKIIKEAMGNTKN